MLVGHALVGLGNYETSVPLLSGILRTRSARFGSNSPALVPVLELLVRSHVGLGTYWEASPLQAQLAAIQESTLGNGHPSHVSTLLQLAETEVALCDLNGAEKSLQRALSLLERAPQRQGELSLVLSSLAKVREQQGDQSQRQALLRRAIEVLPPNPELNQMRLNGVHALATLLHGTGNLAEAIEWLEKGAALEQTQSPPRVSAAAELARALINNGQVDQARAVRSKYHVAHYVLPLRPGATSARLEDYTPSQHSFPSAASRETKSESKKSACVPRRMRTGKVNSAAAVVAGLRGAFRSCYNSELTRDSELEASVRISGHINATGAVTEVSGDAHERVSERLVTCLLQTALQAQFSPPEGGKAQVVVPVTLVRQR